MPAIPEMLNFSYLRTLVFSIPKIFMKKSEDVCFHFMQVHLQRVFT